MTLKERLDIVKEYHKWFEETNGKNDFDLLDCPETLMAFLQSRGLLNERPQGEWIICNQDNEGIHKIECPFCKYVNGSDFGGMITLTFDRLPPFCENCGADMRGERNGRN